MKKIVLSLTLVVFAASASFAKTLPKKSKPKGSVLSFGRECCTRSGTSQTGGQYTVTVCSGWFLSNSANAEARACAAAEEAIRRATQ